MVIDDDSILTRCPGILQTEVGGGETVLLGPDGDSYFGLDGTSAVIWAQLERPVSVRDLCAALAERYDVDAETVARDIRPFLVELRDNMLIEARAAG